MLKGIFGGLHWSGDDVNHHEEWQAGGVGSIGKVHHGSALHSLADVAWQMNAPGMRTHPQVCSKHRCLVSSSFLEGASSCGMATVCPLVQQTTLLRRPASNVLGVIGGRRTATTSFEGATQPDKLPKLEKRPLPPELLPGQDPDEATKDMFPEELAKGSLNVLEKHLAPGQKLPSSLREAAATVAKAGRQLQYWTHRRQALAKELPIYGKELKICYNKMKLGRLDVEDQEAVDSPPSPEAGSDGVDAGAGGPPKDGVEAGATSSLARDDEPMGHTSSIATSSLATDDAPMPPPSSNPNEHPSVNVGDIGRVPGLPLEEDLVKTVECNDFLPSAGVIVGRRAASEAYWQFDRALADASASVERALDDALMRGA